MQQLWSNGFAKKLAGVLLGMSLVPVIHAQNLNPVQDSFRLPVSSFDIALPTSGRQLAFDLAQFQKRLALERARFGEQMTVDELHQVADALTLYLRKSGYAFHTVYLPPQKVEGGVVVLRVQEGVLSGVHVINQTALADKRFSAPFQKLIGKVLYAPEIEEKVQALKTQGGMRVFAFYSRGEKNGEARLNLRVDTDKERTFAIKADNYGSASSGKHRIIAQYNEYQLTGRHDRLSLALLYALDDVDNLYGSVGYQLPFSNLNYVWDVSASNNQFEVGDRFAALGIKGDAKTVRTGLSYISEHRPANRSAWRLGIYNKSNNLETDSTTVADEQSQGVSLQWNKSLQSAKKGAILNSVLEVSQGDFSINGLPDGDFTKLDFSVLTAKGLGRERWRNVWQLSVRGQYSSGFLPSIEGLSLSGAYGVRGFEPGLFNADTAVLASLEWRLPNLLQKADARWRVEPFFFAEMAQGQKENVLGQKRDAQLSGAGFGLNLNWGRRFSAQVIGAKGMEAELDGVKVEGDEQVLFEIRWQ